MVDIDKVFGQLSEFLSCKECHGPITLSETKHVGLSSLFQIFCAKCGVVKVLGNCNLIPDGKGERTSELNKRFVYASHVLGFKNAGMNTLCGLMDMPPPNFYKCVLHKFE